MKIDTTKLAFFEDTINGVKFCEPSESEYMWIGDLDYFREYHDNSFIDVTSRGVYKDGYYSWNIDEECWSDYVKSNVIAQIANLLKERTNPNPQIIANTTNDEKKIYFSGIEDVHIKVNDETMKIIEDLIACGVIERKMHIYKEPVRIIDLT